MEYALFAVWSVLVFLAGVLVGRANRKKADKLASSFVEITEKIKDKVQ